MCTRCGLQYNFREDICPHCKNVTDIEAIYIRKKYKSELSGESTILTRLFVAGFVVVALILLIFSVW
jgi:uncharacterized OB-fold protein